MSQSIFNHVKISGISVVVPEKEINIYDEAEYYDNNIKKIDRMRKMVGFWKRRVVDTGVTPSDLAIQAAETLIADMNINKSEIDAVVFVRQRPDFRQPAVSYFIHNQLGLPNTTAVFDVTQGCPGWVYGLWISHSLIESQACKKVLLLVADTPSAGMDLSNRISAPVFGDGGVATLLEYSSKEQHAYFDIATESKDYEAIMTPASGDRMGLSFAKNTPEGYNDGLLKWIKTPSGYETRLIYGYMDGLAVFNFTMNEVPKSISRIMDLANISEADVPYLILHQANKQIVQTVAQASGFSLEKAPYIAFENYGTNTMCSIPTSINCLKNELKGTNKLLCSSFGNGLAVATCVITLDNAYLTGVKDYKKHPNHPTRQQLIDYWTKKIQG